MADRQMYNDVLEESIKAFQDNAQPNIDIERGILKDLALMTGESPSRKRHYTKKALMDSVNLFENVQAFIDHPTPKEAEATGGVRSYKDLIGWYENVRFQESEHGRLIGDLHLIKGNEQADKALFLAQNKPDIIGNSPRTRGRYYISDGEEYIEQIVNVHSVDLVTSPGTTKSLYETANEEVEVKTVGELKEKNKELYESVLKEGKEARDKEITDLEEKATKAESDLKEARDTIKTLEDSAKEAKESATKTEAKIKELDEKIEAANKAESEERGGAIGDVKEIKDEELIESVRNP